MTELTRRRVLRTAGAGATALGFAGDAAADDGTAAEAAVATDRFEEREWGYVRADFEPPDGTFPSALMMDGYKGASSGESPTALETGMAPTHYLEMRDGVLVAVSVLADHSLAPEGTVLAWASVRGTGCSGGTFDLFDRTGALDGYEIIEWIADREWALDRVGLFGASYSAILGLTVAETQPPSLAAMCVSAMIGDLYRGAVFPGGVPNPVFPSAWTQAYRRAPDTAGTFHGVSDGDELCAQNVATRGQQTPEERAAWLYTQREDDREWRARSPISLAENVEVPTYISHAWQDEQTGPRGGVEMFEAIDPDPASPPGLHGRMHRHESPKLLRTTNGVHNTAHSVALRDVGDWFRYWLAGEDTGILDQPRVRHFLGSRSTSIDAALEKDGSLDLGAYYGPVSTRRLYLDADGTLSVDRPAAGTDQYVTGSPRQGAWVYGEEQVNAATGPITGADGPDVLFYETPAFEEPHVVAGPTAATLFVDSTAPEFDLFVRVSDVGPDGTTPLNRGLLRASHRALDEGRSVFTEDGDVLRPYHPHTNPTQPTPGEVDRYDVEVFPFAHVLYPGHRLQVSVTTPPVADGLWGYEPSRAPGVNTIHRGGDGQASRLVLPLQAWPDDQQLPPEPACGEPAGYRCL